MNDFQTQDKNTVQSSYDTMVNLKNSVTDAKASIQGFKNAIQAVPRMTTRLNRAKKYLITVLDKIIEEYRIVENLSGEAEKLFATLLESIDSEATDLPPDPNL